MFSIAVMDYFFKKFLITQLWCISYPAILKTNLFSHHLSKCNFILNFVVDF